MTFFGDGARERPVFPVREQQLFGYEGRPWTGPPSDHIVPALLPWTVPLGRSEHAIVALRLIEVWPEAMTLVLGVYSRDAMEGGPPIAHRRIPDYRSLLVGVLFPDGRRASSETISVPTAGQPDEPVLRVTGGSGTQFHQEHHVFVWPLPAAGPLEIIVQWLERDIPETHTEFDGARLGAAARDAGELWPGLPRRPGNGVAMRQITGSDWGGERTPAQLPQRQPRPGPGTEPAG
ncbi:hypothetical protein [Amycolatopsis jiangsuensis]|uniref:Acetoacetate decarboxylase n=1 Tax=Amycolatopsis jiangsuensis TaxID=1181879 RepID=A0A840IUB2_9PSEU|nr:hypothetical protein [Amycolatopsis jiangsuensis]MBB4685035.1 hypothetical protein [Amycolatopsis jiangsuensis]